MSAGAHPDFVVRQEEDRIATPTISVIAVSTVVIGAIAVLLSGIMLTGILGTLQPSAAGSRGVRAAGRDIADLEQTSIIDLEYGVDLGEQQRGQLHKYGWIERDAGIAAVPIERAIDRVVEEAR
jgi:hypothetical protein